MTGFEFPAISPVIFAIGPIAVRWYSMAYLIGIVAAWLLILRLIKKYDLPLTRQQVEDTVFFTTIGIVVGGRLGYVLFYGGEYYLQNPLKILQYGKVECLFMAGQSVRLWGFYIRHILAK